jgi:hypothetical protein
VAWHRCGHQPPDGKETEHDHHHRITPSQAEGFTTRRGQVPRVHARAPEPCAARESGQGSVAATSGLAVQACGDAHLSNFGVFGSPERTLVFDINDFDETLPGPWEWDVTRLAASMAIAGRNNGFNDVERRGVVLAAVAAYRSAVTEFAGMTNLGVWYARASVQAGLPRLRSMLGQEGAGSGAEGCQQGDVEGQRAGAGPTDAPG